MRPWPTVGTRCSTSIVPAATARRGAIRRFPNKIVPIETVGTDPVRLSALTVGQRTLYSKSWFGQYGKEPFVADPGGYVAPPLDGIWASAPYFHNGSVPTLWHVLARRRTAEDLAPH